MNQYLFKAPFRMNDEWEDRFVEAFSKMRIGKDFYPGNYTVTWKWPFVVAGDRGVLNTMSPKYGNLEAFLDIPQKPQSSGSGGMMTKSSVTAP